MDDCFEDVGTPSWDGIHMTYPENHLVNTDGLLNEVQHLRNAQIYMVEELTPEVFLDFCDGWGPAAKAKVMISMESAKARGNITMCRHKPGGKFQWMEIHRDLGEDLDFLMPWLANEAAWSPLNGEAEVHTLINLYH